MPRVCLVTGGARSGKSQYARERATHYTRPVYLATGVPIDDEMRERIARHRVERGDQFLTIEEPLDVARALCALPPGTDVVLVECLTTWLGNLLYQNPLAFPRCRQIDDLLKLLGTPPCDLIVVTNEVGWGIVAESALSRRFRDAAGWVNQCIAKVADEVILMVCGIPMWLKGNRG